MSVIRIKGRTTNKTVDFDGNSMSVNSLIYLSPLNDDMQNFSVDVRLGDGWNDNYSQQSTELKKISDKIIIRKHGSIVVEVAEEIRVPHNRYGIVLPTGSLFLEKGVMITAAKVEPGFHGKLKVRLYNTTNRKIVIEQRSKLGSIIFFSTDTTIRTDPIYRRSDISASRETRRGKFLKFLSEHKAQAIGWGVSLIIALTGATYTWYINKKPLDQAKDAPSSIQKPDDLNKHEKGPQ